MPPSLSARRQWVDRMPLHLVDKPGRYLREALRQLVWRVSPAGPRVLHVSGVDTERAWSMNRTRVIHALREAGLVKPGGRLRCLLSVVVGLLPVRASPTQTLDARRSKQPNRC